MGRILRRHIRMLPPKVAKQHVARQQELHAAKIALDRGHLLEVASVNFVGLGDLDADLLLDFLFLADL